jgi:VanZ family protein
MRARRRLLLWAPVVLLLAHEFWLSSRTGAELPSLGPSFDGKDKVEHAAYFFLTGLLAVRAARVGEGWSRRKTAAILIFGAALWGCSDEFHQSFVPGRDVEAGDVAADVAGVGLAVVAGGWILRTSGLEREA